MTLAELANVRQLKAVQTKVVDNYLMNDVFFNVRQFTPYGTSNGSTMSLTVNKFDEETAGTRDFGTNYVAGEAIPVPETYYLYPIGKGIKDDKALSRGLTENGRSKWLDTQVRSAVNATKKYLAKAFIDGITTPAGGVIKGLKAITTDKSLTFNEVFDGTVAPSAAQAQAFLVWFNKAKSNVPHANSIECSVAMGSLLESYGALLNMYTETIIVTAEGAPAARPIKKFAGMPIVTYDNVNFTVGDGATQDTFEEFYLVYNSEEDGVSLGLPDSDDEIMSVSLPIQGEGRSSEEGVVEILTQVIDMTDHSLVRVTGYQIFDVV